jgi:hypothetical protein
MATEADTFAVHVFIDAVALAGELIGKSSTDFARRAACVES